MKRKVLSLVSITAFVATFVFLSAEAYAAQNSGEPSLVGTWQTSVTVRNCLTGDPAAPTAFPGILTFNLGGTMTGTSTAVTSVYGVWERSPGPREYTFASISLRYSPTGVFLGSRRITQSVTIGEDGDTFTSRGQFQDTDPAGVQTAQGCSTSVGTRFQ